MTQPLPYAPALDGARAALEAPGLDDAERFGQLTDAVVFGRVRLLARMFVARHGARVHGGPFAGMALPTGVSDGCFLPKLLGCYEQELHGAIAALPRRDVRRVVVVGCAEGYYAVGLARLLLGATVVAFDIDPRARTLCAALATANGVADRVRIAAEATSAELDAALAEAPAFLLCDCEGCEYALLDPARVPGLRRAHAVVELHGAADDAGRIDDLLGRFAATHDVALIGHGPRDPAAMPALAGWKQLDQWLAVWEFRGQATPWAVLAPRIVPASAG
ncbi:MAG: hypothetical protein ACREER_07060 [Alphaproteobacteria bacterium]